MMMRKITFYPLYEETLVIESVTYDGTDTAASYTHHWTLKTHQAAKWETQSLLRELADRLDEQDNEASEVRF
jgi:hypothetical protein